MKQKLSRLWEILASGESLKDHINEIYELRVALEDALSEEQKLSVVSQIKNRIQIEAEMHFVANNSWGAIYAATGSGKSKIAVNIAETLVRQSPMTPNILLCVPTEKLRDEGWHDEFKKWEHEDVYNVMHRTCYASLNKYVGKVIDLLILDEGHNITELNSTFFDNNIVRRCILLTATKPRDAIKLEILEKLKIESVYELSLDDAVKLGLVAPYDITVITMTLDGDNKYIKAGRKDKPFFNTEKGQYGYLTSRVFAAPHKQAYIDRMQFIYNLRSKTQVAKAILEHIVPEGLRTLIFCGSKAQANEVCAYRYYSKPTPPKKLKEGATPFKLQKYEEDYAKYQAMLPEYQGNKSYDAFKAGEIDRMSCVAAVNEGHNFNDLDVGFIIQLNSNEKDLIQRIGRLLRYRPGYVGKIIILCAEDTVDKDWVKKATMNLSATNIRWVELSHIRMGLETISFD